MSDEEWRRDEACTNEICNKHVCASRCAKQRSRTVRSSIDERAEESSIITKQRSTLSNE